ncbi:hypothetical protein [Flavobacterium limnosediminis]|nr:hypothetical protein [Flavobacterium limnosediminis]
MKIKVRWVGGTSIIREETTGNGFVKTLKNSWLQVAKLQKIS